jgi:hypothetical protein
MTGPADAGQWPVGAAEEIDQWRQGHVLDGAPVSMVSTAAPFWAAGQPVGVELAGLSVLAGPVAEAQRAMVVSQGCELVKGSFPAATVVPVYEASAVLTEHQMQTARAGLTWHLVHLTSDWAKDAFWVADLRVEYPIDKSVLLGKQPLEAFADEVGYAKLAERLAALRQRSPVPQPTIEHVVTPLRVQLATLRESGGNPLAGVREVRIASNHHTAPTAVTLYVVGDGSSPVDVTAWTTAVDAITPLAGSNGITLVGPEITTLWDMSAADYLTSHPVEDADSS